VTSERRLGLVDHFIRNIKKTGAVSSCSQEVAKVLVKTADLTNSKAIVELGSGTGVITKELLVHIPKDALFFALEVNDHFVAETKKCCPQANVYHDTAENVKIYLNKHGKETCDCIVSTLPWTLFDEPLQKRILDALVEVLPPGGQFLTVAYTFSGLLPAGIRFRKLLKSSFSQVKRTKPIWKNVPPVYVYVCKK
jgi:phosphatidylethanolamine/phosphatidyl-N-methylethanolamine N-methyltransferase